MKAMNKILVPVDFSECSAVAADLAAALAERFGATVDVLHVWEPPRYLVPDAMVYIPGGREQSLVDFAKSEAGKEMDAFLERLEARTEQAVQGRLEWGDPAKAIVETAEDGGYDLIVMGTHGRTGFRHLLMGSIAEKVVRRAPCPVLTTRANTADGEVSGEGATAR